MKRLIILSALCLAPLSALADSGDGNFTVDEFNAAWVRQGGPDVMTKTDFTKYTPLAPRQQYGDYDNVELGTEKDFIALNRATTPSWWLRLWSSYNVERGARWIADNPLLPNAVIGFSELCQKVVDKPLDDAARFSAEYLSKRSFLTNRHPKLTDNDLDYIRRFHGIGYDRGNLLETCNVLEAAYTLSKPKMVENLKTTITSTNRVTHQCGSEKENEERVNKQAETRQLLKTFPVTPLQSFYDMAANPLPFLGGPPPASPSALECQPYYDHLIERRLAEIEARKQEEKQKDDDYKNNVINSQSIQ